MAVQISENGRLFTLHTKNSSYQMYADPFGTLLHLYYGKRTDGENLSDLILRTDMGFAGNPPQAGSDRTYSLDYLPQELPSSGVGDYRDDCVRIRHSDGSCAAQFLFDSFQVTEGSYSIPGMPALYDTAGESGQTLTITLREACSDVRVQLLYGVFERSDIITRALKVVNAGKTPIVLEKALSMSMDILFGDYDMIFFAGRHAMERTLCRLPVKRAGVHIGSVRGTSSHHYNPSLILCSPQANEDAGDCYGFCLAYSGDFTASAQQDQRGTTRVQAGIHPDRFSFRLEPGESFPTPQAILSYSSCGLSALSQNYHRILREHMCRGPWKHERRPVLINNWEATYFDFDKDKLLSIASQAAELGIEMLVLDDGWFGKRNDDNSGLGDWFVNTEKLGGALGALSEEIHCMGMKFGLWFEPEMISEDSDLYRAHPDWALTIPGREPNRGRNQLVLDMANPEVRSYLLERMTDILSHAQIDYVKWDMNRSICDAYSSYLGPERTGEVCHRYVLGVYDLMERFLSRFPGVLLEGCSGGGGRFDAAMLYYSPQIWCSDNTDAVNRLSIQYGTSFFYPVSAVGAHVSACPNHQTGRSVPFRTRGDVAMAGSFGYELDLNQVSEEEKEQVKEQIEAFRHFYSLTHEGDYYRLTAPGQKDFMAWQFVDRRKERAMLTVVQTESFGNPIPIHTDVKGLDPAKKYRCLMNGAVRSGASWMGAGLTPNRILKQYESLVIEFAREP